MAYNKKTTVYESNYDLALKAKLKQQAIKKMEDRNTMSKEDMFNYLEYLAPGNDYVKESNLIIKASKNKVLKNKSLRPDYKDVNDILKNLKEYNFYDIISNKNQTGSELIKKTIDFNGKIFHSNQKGGSSNESLGTWNESFRNFTSLKKQAKLGNEATVFGFDLETVGSSLPEGMWKADHITEFSMQEMNLATNEILRNDTIAIGLTEDQGKKIIDDIEKAIKSGTLEKNENLRVSAMRYSLYGDDKVTYEKTAEGYYKFTNFIDSKKHEMYNIEKIKAGVNKFVSMGNDTDYINGVRADHYYVGQSIKHMKDKVVDKQTAMLLGQNHLGHDNPIMQYQMSLWNELYKDKTNMFENLDLTMSPNQTIDLLGGLRLHSEYYDTGDLYPKAKGLNMSEVKTIRGQEYLVQSHLKKWFEQKGLKPHLAEDDVTALLGLFTMDSEILKSGTLVDLIGDKMSKVNYKETALETNKHILKAKKRAGLYQGKGYLNFANDKEGNIYTASDHILSDTDGFAKSNGGVIHNDFNVGAGINKGAFYDLKDIQEITIDDNIRSQIDKVAPEYSGNKLYHVKLGMITSDNHKDTRLGNLEQNIILKSEQELQGFLSSTFDVVAKRDENGNIQIAKEHIEDFDIRKLSDVKGRAVAKDVNKNYDKNHNELLESAVEAHNKKLLVSRAENSFLQDDSFNKLSKALTLKDDLKDFLEQENVKVESLKQKEINQIMSAKVASGNMPLGLNEVQLEHAKEIINNALSYKKDYADPNSITRILDSSIDNYSSAMIYVENNNNVLSKIIDTLKQSEMFTKEDGRYKNSTKEYRQEVFNRVYKKVKEETAEHIYRNLNVNNPIKNKSILNDETLQAAVSEFRNIYEVDYNKIAKTPKVNFVSIAKPEELQNLVKLDISTKGASYKLTDAAIDAVYGKDYKRKIDNAHKNVAVAKMFNLLMEDENLKETDAFKGIMSRYGYNEKTKSFKENINHIDISERIVSGMQSLKEKNVTAGIVNTKRAFMKSLEGTSGYTKALNSEEVLNKVDDIAKSVLDNLDMTIINTAKPKDQISELVENKILKHYIADSNTVEKAQDWVNNPQLEMLYKKGKKDLKEYLTDTIYGFTKLGAEVSVQENGALIVSRNGETKALETIPKILLNDKTLYTEIGSQKFQFNRVLDIKGGTRLEGDVKTTISSINKYSNSAYVDKLAEEFDLNKVYDSLWSRIGRDINEIRKGSTINGFSGNDIISNYNVDMGEIKNVLYDIFNKDGNHYGLFDNIDFPDKQIQETLKKKLENVGPNKLDNKGQLKELGPDITRDIAKDTIHMLQELANKQGFTDDFKTIVAQLGLSGQEKRVAGLTAYSGIERPTNSVFGVFDNVQRPPITQSGNAKFLRESDIEKAKDLNVLAGNVISSASMNAKGYRNFDGVGKASTDVMMDISYVSTNALHVLMESNFEDVINKSSVEYGTKEASKKAMEHLKSTLSTFEQERIIDSRVHEAVYGLQTANTQKLSRNLDAIGMSKELTDEEFKKQFDFITNHRGNFSYSNGKLEFKSSVGTYVKRGEGTIQTKGFADLPTSFSSKMKDGVFNFNFYNENGMKLRDNEINNLINDNIEHFIKDGKLVDKAALPKILEDLLETKNIKGQYAIEDAAALGYAKTMTSGAEKGMTDIVYATTGRYNKEIEKVFKNIGMWDDVKAKVLTEEGTDAILKRGMDRFIGKHTDMTPEQNILHGTSFKNIKELKSAMETERHMNSKLLFEHVLGGKTHMLANDNILGHENFGAMYQGSLSKAIDLFGKNHKDGSDGAIKEIIDIMNNGVEKTLKDGTVKKIDASEFQFLENWNLKDGKVDIGNIGVQYKNGRFHINENFLTNPDNVSNLNSKKFNNLLREIDSRFAKDDSSDDRLVWNNVYMQTGDVDEKGTPVLKKVDEVVGSFFTREIDGKRVILGTQSRENNKYVTDVETQSGVTDEYFQLKKAIKKNKIDLINNQKSLNETDDKHLKASLIEEKISLEAKGHKLESELSSYDGAVKTMKVSDQELSIYNRVAITQSHVNKVNDLISEGKITDESLAVDSLRGHVIKNVDGQIMLEGLGLENELNSNKDVYSKGGIRVLDPFVSRLKEKLLFNELEDEVLTMKYVNKHPELLDIYNKADSRGETIGINKAKEIHQGQLSIDSYNFNLSSQTSEQVKALENKGFRRTNINELSFDADDVATENLLIDFGEEFKEHRYLAVPGNGKSIMDEDLRKESQNQLASLQHRYQEYASYKGKDPEKTEQLWNNIIKQRDDVMDTIENEMYGKHGIFHNASKVEIDNASYRLKASGIIGDQTNPTLRNYASHNGVNVIDSSKAGVLDIAMIDGKTITELESKGVYHDYKFVSRDQMDNMGFFREDRLKQFGFEDDASSTAIEKMEDFLKTHGTMDLSDRYPNTKTGSISTARVFLDGTLTGNQTKVSASLALKANGDFDGDSFSSFHLEKYDSEGRRIDGAYYSKVKTDITKQLNDEGILEPTSQMVTDRAVKQGLIDQQSYNEFNQIQQQMSLNAVSGNRDWIDKANEILTKDMLKNPLIGDMSNASMIQNGHSDFLSYNVTSKMSRLPSLQEFNSVESDANQLITTAKDLVSNEKVRKQFSTEALADIDKIAKIENVRNGDPVAILDKSLALIEQGVKVGAVSEDVLDSAKNTVIKKIGHDKHVQEIMAKTGLAATGGVNLALNSVKLAAQFTETSPSQIGFTNYIWQALDIAEQGIISDKKRKSAGYDDPRITQFSDAMDSLFKRKENGSRNQAIETGRKQLGDWMDENGNGIFNIAFEHMGKDILGEAEYNRTINRGNASVEGAIKMKEAFLDKMVGYAKDDMFISTVASMDSFGRNGGIRNSLKDVGAAAAESTTFRSTIQNYLGMDDKGAREVAYRKAAIRNKVPEATSPPVLETNNITKEVMSETVESSMKHIPSIPMKSVGGLGMAMLGTAAGLMVSGYASGNPLKDKQASEVAGQQTLPQQNMSVPQFMEQGGMVTGNTQGGYVINLQADTKKGRKYMQRMMAQAAEASVGGAVSVNMNLRDVSKNGITDRDIEDFMNRHL